MPLRTGCAFSPPRKDMCDLPVPLQRTFVHPGARLRVAAGFGIIDSRSVPPPRTRLWVGVEGQRKEHEENAGRRGLPRSESTAGAYALWHLAGCKCMWRCLE